MNRRIALWSLLTFAAACGGSSSDIETLKGAIAGADGSGTMTLKFPRRTANLASSSGATESNTATGSINFTGKAAISLTGTIDQSTGAFTLSGSNFTVTGTYNNQVASGSVAGPLGTNSYTVRNTSNGTVKVYCGTYSDSAASGIFNMVIDSTTNTVAGTYYDTGSKHSGTFVGTVANNAITLTDNPATGTVNGDSVSGTYPAKGTISAGTWSGSVGACN